VRQLTATRFVVVSALFCALCVDYIAASQAQTIWSGVYTEAQAYRGEKIADTSCIGCHGSGLDGGDSGPKLVGEMFLANWSSQSVAQLFDWVREAMPSDAPGTLSKDDTAAVLAYILKLNKMPAGKQPLPTDNDALARIQFVADKP
jgi:mono/diheme cytochrome c family protein